MSSITRFDDLPDLVLIELLSYLSSFDVLWTLTGLNHRLTILINERGFFHHINLSSARYHQFQTILRFLPLNEIRSLTIDTHASPLQLARWPYLPHLTTLCIIDSWNFDELSLYILRHAVTLTHLIIKTNERSIADGLTIERSYPIGDMKDLIDNVVLGRLPALRSLDGGMNYFQTCWPFTHAIVPLTYIRLYLPNINSLVRLMSTPPLCETLRQLHIQTNNCVYPLSPPPSISALSIEMVNLQTFTLVQSFFYQFIIEWTHFELLTSSMVMPALRRANISLFMNINDFSRIRSAPIFNDHRRVEVNFAFSVINCPQYNEMTRFIPCGGRFYPREIVGATFVANEWIYRSEWPSSIDPYNRERPHYHHMWYTLPWAFDQFFHQNIPYKWITKVHVFHRSPQTTTTTKKSSLRTLDASGQTLASCLSSLPQVVLGDYLQTFHLSFNNRSIHINLPNLRNLTLVNSINCLNCCSQFPPTIRAIRILLFHGLPNYMLPNWPVVLNSLSSLQQLTSLRIFMYDLLKTFDDHSCQLIGKAASLFSDFSFCFRYQSVPPEDENFLEMAFKDHAKFIKQLCHYVLLLNGQKTPDYSIETDGCGLMIWS